MSSCDDYIFMQMFQMNLSVTKENLIEHYGMNEKTAEKLVEKWGNR